MTAVATETLQPTADTLDAAEADPAIDDGVLADMLIEEISIDGMCGVY